jgi:hypothetical protein
MRTFIVGCLVALVVAVGMSFVVGLVEIGADHSDSKCVMTITVNTSMIHPISNALHPGRNDSSESPGQDALDVTGKIAAVRPEKDEFVVSENFKSWTFRLATGGKVFINDRETGLSELQPGDDATVTFDRQGPLMLATVVRSTRK